LDELAERGNSDARLERVWIWSGKLGVTVGDFF
jgi:hypothetical protein